MMWSDSKARRNKARLAQSKGLAATASAPPTLPPGAIAELQANIQGTVVLPGDPNYSKDSGLANPRFVDHPEVIVYCEVGSDVAECLKVAQKYTVPMVVRSGGHSTAGYSGNNGMILDVSLLNGIGVHPNVPSVNVGPGCNFGNFNKAIEAFDLHAPGGACPDVCQGGYMQGGGYGFTARMFGMHCDQPELSFVMLANGKIVEASPTVNSDLFWAIRGGTGNNFGVLLNTVIPLRRGATFNGFSICWQLTGDSGVSNAANALSWLQENFIRTATPDLGFQMMWVFEGPDMGPKVPYFLIRGMYDGSEAQMLDTLAPVLALAGATLQYTTGPMVYSALNEHLLTLPYEIPEFPPNIVPYPPMENKLSRYIADTVPPDGWATLMEHFLNSPNPFTTVAFEVYGGAINARDTYFNAFVHRDVDFDCFMDVFWLSADQEPVMMAFLAEWEELITPYWNGMVYQNYPFEGDTEFAAHYWAGAYTSLQLIKHKYDPSNFFQFPQSIVPSDTAAPGAFVHPGIAEPISYQPAPKAPGQR